MIPHWKDLSEDYDEKDDFIGKLQKLNLWTSSLAVLVYSSTPTFHNWDITNIDLQP